MGVHSETEGALHEALWGEAVPAGVTAIGDVARRFSVYRNNVHHSLIEAIGERFPVVRRLVGPSFFAAAARDFVRTTLPDGPVLTEYGWTFPAFLAGLGPVARLPYLPDVARLEWLRGRAYHAADAEALTPAAFREAVRMEGQAGLTLHPSMSLFASPYPAVSIWRANHGGEKIPITPGPEAALVFRDGEAVPVLPVSQDLLLIVGALHQGHPLTAIARDADPQTAAEALSVLLRHALVTGLAACSTQEEMS